VRRNCLHSVVLTKKKTLHFTALSVDQTWRVLARTQTAKMMVATKFEFFINQENNFPNFSASHQDVKT
jgi:hypothetical protein